MDITYIPAFAEIIEKCKSAPFNVCNNPANLGKAVKEDRIWQVYWHWSSFVPTTNRFEDAPRAVQVWAAETAVWDHFFDQSVPGYAFFRSDPRTQYTLPIFSSAVKPQPAAVQPPTPLVHHPSAMHSPPAERSHSAVDSPPASLPLQNSPTAPVPPVSAPTVFTSEDLTRIFAQWRPSDGILTVTRVDTEEAAGADQ